MKLPEKYSYIPILGALLYGITTPVGIAAGLGVRTTYNPGSTKASIVYGVLDSISAGILLYTGLVEVKILRFV
jgi:zinc transporter 1/2/3